VAGVAVGGFLDAFLPRLFFHAQLSYARVQPVIGIHPDRSRVDGELGYFITPRLSVRFLESYLVTRDGIDLYTFTPMTDGVFHKHRDPNPAPGAAISRSAPAKQLPDVWRRCRLCTERFDGSLCRCGEDGVGPRAYIRCEP
jgi:hypothetical protein